MKLLAVCGLYELGIWMGTNQLNKDESKCVQLVLVFVFAPLTAEVKDKSFPHFVHSCRPTQ